MPMMHMMAHALSVAQRDIEDVRPVIAILSILTIWLYASSTSVSQFLSEGVNLQNVRHSLLKGKINFYSD